MARAVRFPSVAALALAAGCGACGFINDVDGPTGGLAIKKFSVSPKQVSPGSVALLSWDVEGAEEVRIDNGVGVVKPKGTLEVRADRSTTYNITAKAGTTSATASVQLLVPTSTASPTPSPSPTASPTPAPSPTPTPSASPTPQPSPTGSSACGPSVERVQGCAVTVQRLVTLPAGECIEISRLALSQGCPMATGAARAVSFDVMAETQLRDLRWRKAAASRDGFEPGDGRLTRHGSTNAIATQTVQEPALTIEILSEGAVVLTFQLRNQ
jgi:hypothetical protein